MSAIVAVSLTGLARRFGRRWVLRGVDLEVESGEIIGLTGRNGSGKTTLLRVCAGLLRATRGEGRIFGADLVEEAAALRGRVGMLAHEAGVYANLTAAENLAFSLRMAGQHADWKQIDDALDRVRLRGERDARTRGFSAGMKRRLALARLLLRPPAVLLLDEPYASFDADGIHLVNAFAVEIASNGGAVIVATHDLTRGIAILQRYVEMADGRLQPVEVARAPGAAAGSRVEDAPVNGPAAAGALLGFRGELRRVLAIVWKDLTAERRTKANFNAVAFLAALILLLFGFAIGPDQAAIEAAAAGLVWLTVLFSGVLSFNRSWEQELEDGALEALLLYPGDRRSIFLGKLIANLLFVFAVEAVLVPVATVLYDLPVLEHAFALAGVIALGTLGFVTLGTFYAALASRMRAREVLLPLLLFPMLIPLLVGAVESTGQLLHGDAMGNAGAWIRLLIVFDVIFLVASIFAFEHVIEE